MYAGNLMGCPWPVLGEEIRAVRLRHWRSRRKVPSGLSPRVAVWRNIFLNSLLLVRQELSAHLRCIAVCMQRSRPRGSCRKQILPNL
jgi:hypothetical protein